MLKVTTKCEPVIGAKDTGTVVVAPGTVESAMAGRVILRAWSARGDGHGGGHRVPAVGDHLQVQLAERVVALEVVGEGRPVLGGDAQARLPRGARRCRRVWSMRLR